MMIESNNWEMDGCYNRSRVIELSQRRSMKGIGLGFDV